MHMYSDEDIDKIIDKINTLVESNTILTANLETLRKRMEALELTVKRLENTVGESNE